VLFDGEVGLFGISMEVECEDLSLGILVGRGLLFVRGLFGK
jgi:hypothetical protein